MAVCVQTGKKHAQGNLHPIVFNILITNQIKSLNCWHDSNSKKNIFQELRLDIYQEEPSERKEKSSERKEESSKDKEAPQQEPLRSTSDSAYETGAEQTTSEETTSDKKPSEETTSAETTSEKKTSEETTSAETTSEKKMPEETTSEEINREHTEESLSKRASSEEISAQEV